MFARHSCRAGSKPTILSENGWGGAKSLLVLAFLAVGTGSSS
jgi:hypothetical protein